MAERTRELRGWVSAHSEQGMEGAVEWIFQDAACAVSRETGWRLEGMRLLGEGDLLTITGDDGLRLFSGVIRKRRRHGFLRHRIVSPGEGGWYPVGVRLDDWTAWMNRTPPLAARLRPAPLPGPAIEGKAIEEKER